MAAEGSAHRKEFGDPLHSQSAFEIALRCTVCKAPMINLCCTTCGFEMREYGGAIIISDSPWFRRMESGQQMGMERHALFYERYGTASDSIKSLEFLTDDYLQALEMDLSIQWTVHRPWYGWQWAMRPWIARAYGRREPSRFRIYVATKNA